MISAWRRETSLPGTTTSHEASRPKTRDAPAIAYSRPSVKETTRPPVPTVTFPPFASALAWAIACGTLIAWTYCVLPLRRSSTKVSSWPPTSTLSPCSSGVGSAPRRTPLMRTSAAGDALRMITWPSAWPCSRACCGSTAAPASEIAQPASLPTITSPTGMVNFLPPSSSNAMWEAGSYARRRNRARKHGLRDVHRLLASHQPAPQPVPEEQRAGDHGRVAVDEPPNERVQRQLRGPDIDLHDRRGKKLGEPRRPWRRREVEQEGDERLEEEDVDEVGGNTERAQRDVSRQQLIGVRRRREEHGPKQRQPPLRVAECDQARVRPVDPFPQLLDARRDAVAPPLQPASQPVHGIPHPGRKYHRDQHDDTQDPEDRETGAKQTVVGDPQDHIVLREGLAGAEVNGERSGDGEEHHRGDERHEGGRHRFGEPHAGPPHDPHHGRPRTGLERGEVCRPGAHAPGDDHVLQPDARMYVPGDDPQSRSSAEPVHRGEAQPHRHPPPLEVQQRADDRLDVLAIHGEHDDDTRQRDD